ncbi:MAG: hypothetical protein ACRCZF_04605 [Gemmataceae bacterium]
MTTLLLALTLATVDIESGPKAGEKAPTLPVKFLSGDRADKEKEQDAAKEFAELPAVYLFVNSEKFSRPMARLFRELDGKLGETHDKAVATAVWVGGDHDKSVEYLPKVQQSLKLSKIALAVNKSDASGPNGWGLNSDAHLTVVIVGNGVVKKSFAFVSVNESDAKGILEELGKLKK